MHAEPNDECHAPLDIARVREECRDLTIGSDLRYFPSVDSTNRVARDLPAGTWRDGTVIITDYQQAGRGRRGRSWMAPPGSSLLFSIILAPAAEIPPAHTTMVAALAASDAVLEMCGLRAQLKWPNDVLISGRKLCGILAERSEQRGAGRVILGVGMNVNILPGEIPDIPSSTTSLQWELGCAVERARLAVGLFKSCDLWYRYLTWNPNSVFSTWVARLDTIGNAVLVSDTDGRWEGVATGVQRDGALLVQDDKGESHAVYAADVSIRRRDDVTSP